MTKVTITNRAMQKAGWQWLSQNDFDGNFTCKTLYARLTYGSGLRKRQTQWVWAFDNQSVATMFQLRFGLND